MKRSIPGVCYNALVNGRLIVIEGVDGSGKTTQFKLLKSYFEHQGKRVQSIHFPRHQQRFFGVLIDDYLNGKFGDATKLDPRLASVLYACDRFEAKEQINNWLKEGQVVVLDRYMTSNKGHQLCKLEREEEKQEMLSWLDELEYEVFGIPRPDHVFYLDVPLSNVREMIAQRDSEGKDYIDGDYDQHEADENHIKKAQEAYSFTVEKYDYWHRIKCHNGERLLNPQEVSEKIINLIS